MTRDEILNMAREAGLNPRLNNPGEWWGYTGNIERFAALVAARAAAAEREACAKVCEDVHVRPIMGASEEYMQGKEMAVQQCAAAIRARSKT